MGPTIPSGTKRCAFWKFITEALVIGPKMPSEVIFNLVCKHFTCSPLLPCLKVRLIKQAGLFTGMTGRVGGVSMTLGVTIVIGTDGVDLERARLPLLLGQSLV